MVDVIDRETYSWQGSFWVYFCLVEGHIWAYWRCYMYWQLLPQHTVASYWCIHVNEWGKIGFGQKQLRLYTKIYSWRSILGVSFCLVEGHIWAYWTCYMCIKLHFGHDLVLLIHILYSWCGDTWFWYTQWPLQTHHAQIPSFLRRLGKTRICINKWRKDMKDAWRMFKLMQIVIMTVEMNRIWPI